MALAKTRCATIEGVTAFMVDVEANIGPGLPGMYVVGLAGAAMAEAKDRLKTAMRNVGLPWPKTKLVVNLSPADVRKSGTQFDLAICAAVMSATLNVPTAGTMFLGEVGLDGCIKPVPGVLPALLAARAAGVQQIVIAAGNAGEAALPIGIDVYVAEHLNEVAQWLLGQGGLDRPAALTQQPRTCPDMADVVGQPEARLAAEIAAAGGHHLMLIGPPGSGKSMIAARLPGIMPQLNIEETIATTAIHSVAGNLQRDPIFQPPFVAPHHNVSQAALLGGGSGKAKPGAVSLAHHGVLFLDEVSHINSRVLDSLRLPLESGEVCLQRANREVVFPARFQLVLAANPCQCGAEEPTQCSCSVSARRRYLRNISGPLRDRIDLCVCTRSRGAMIGGDTEDSATIADRVLLARDRAKHRWGSLSCDMMGRVLRREYPADDVAMAYLAALLADGQVSQRGIDRSLRVAWTLADLASKQRPDLAEVTQALELHDAGFAGER